MSLSMPENKQVREIAEDFSISTKGNKACAGALLRRNWNYVTIAKEKGGRAVRGKREMRRRREPLRMALGLSLIHISEPTRP